MLSGELKETTVAKILALIVVVLVAGLPDRYQAATVTDLTRAVLVIEHYWYREFPSTVSDFFSGAGNAGCGDESFDQHSYHHRERKHDELNSQLCLAVTMASPRDPSENYIYRVKLRNNGNKVITALAWDYVFVDPETSVELDRHSFFSETKLSPGKTTSLIAVSLRPPSRVIPARMLHQNGRPETYAERVEIKNVYIDSSYANSLK